MLAELYVLSGRDAGKLIEAVGPTIFLGRAATNHYRVRDPQASRVHCRIDITSTGLTIEDTNSGNGTYLNDTLLEELRLLADGDEIRIGTTRLKVLMETETDREWERTRREDSAIVPICEGDEGSDLGDASEIGDVGDDQTLVELPAESSEPPAASVIPEADASSPEPELASTQPLPSKHAQKPASNRSSTRRRGLRDLLPGYRLEKRLTGSGHHGIAVYRATQRSLERTVTLKVFLPRGEVRKADVDRFLHEARAIARLPHPNIVTIHDIITRGKMRVIVTEHLAGGSLADRLDDEQPMDTQEVFDVGEALASALGYLHRQGVVHRNLKPHNVLFAPELDTFKLAGFGFATGPDQEHLGDTSFLESPLEGFAFLAPEQLSADLSRITPATDVYSLGATLYLCATRRAPFSGDRTVALAACVLRDPPPPMPSSVPPDLRALIERCLNKKPEDRYTDANVLLGELRACRAKLAP